MNFQVIKSSEILKSNKILNAYDLYNYPESFFIFSEEKNKYIIFINDLDYGLKRQRFSLAHEIMHICLEHKNQNQINEKEANFGAGYLLAPISLVLKDKNNLMTTDTNFIEKTFNVSKYVALRIIDHSTKRKQYCSSKEKNYEIEINNLLKKSFLEKENNYLK